MKRHMSILFDFECWPPFGEVEVIATEKGAGILIIDKKTDDEIDFDLLRASDQARIKALVKEWADHYLVMRKEPHPADEAFNKQYVDSLNKKGE